jgi:hypothetical protein
VATKLSINGVVFSGRSEIDSWSPQPQSGGVKVDWGGNDVEILSGESWTIEKRLKLTATGFTARCVPYPWVAYFYAPHPSVITIQQPYFGGCRSYYLDLYADGVAIAYHIYGFRTDAAFQVVGFKVTANGGATSERETEVIPNVSLLMQGCNLTINYTNGSTRALNFEACPQEIFPIEDEDQICQEACNLANEISRKLGI